MECSAQPTVRSDEVDVFMGVDLNYRDIFLSKPYELLVNLTPGVKWNMGRQWQVAAQVLLPVYGVLGSNATLKQYGDVAVKVQTSNRQHTGGGN